MLTLCTLFDHNYLDKGLAMYESLERVCDEFELYVLAMSDKCYEILTKLNYPNLKPIKLEDFEDEELLRVKPTRKVGEYCWTCASSLIRYVLITYNPEYCTYIDSDLYFYSNPQVLIDEMKQKRASVLVVGHRFNKSEKKQREWMVGRYCVEFNTFKNDENGLKLVNIWRNQCLEHCSIDGDGIYWGDQKYLDHWCEDYPFCIETEHLGAGIAPWNITSYKLDKNSLQNQLTVKCGDRLWPAIFYHFENIQYIERNIIRINLYRRWNIDNLLVNRLYPPYLKTVDKEKNLIKQKFGLDILIKYHPGIEVEKKRNLGSLIKSIFKLSSYKNFLFEKLPKRLFEKKDVIYL